jgi:hypothetical protein
VFLQAFSLKKLFGGVLMKKYLLLISVAVVLAISITPARAQAEEIGNCPNSHNVQSSVGKDKKFSRAEAAALSSSEIDELGLPPRPATDDRFESWFEEINLPRLDSFTVCDLPEQVSALTYSGGPIWSGYLAQGSSSTTYVGVQGDFTVPVLGQSNCSDAASSYASWVGLGGNGVPQLVQGGLAYLKNSNTPIHFGFTDYTRGFTSSLPAAITLAQNFNGSTAEWVEERLTYNSAPSQLRNFGAITWTNAQAEKSNFSWYNLGTQSYVPLDMFNGSKALAYPDALISTSSFKDNFIACT